MTDLILSNQNILPDKLDDLAKFVLIGKDKLQAVRAEINAICQLLYKMRGEEVPQEVLNNIGVVL